MRVLVVYESMFGNTRAVADAIGEGLVSRGASVEVVEVGGAPPAPDADVDLLVVGGPTHAFGLSRASTRSSAAEQATGPIVSTGIGLRDWLEALPRPTGATVAASFDTHADKKFPGSAARGAEKRLRHRGYRAIVPAESFYVSDMQGPLVAGELDRARSWGAELGAVTSPA